MRAEEEKTLDTTSNRRGWRGERRWAKGQNRKGRRELQNQVGNQDENTSTGQNSKNITGEEGGLEAGAERAKMPLMRSKEKVTELGWQARTMLTRRWWFEGSHWKDKEVLGARGKALGNSGWREWENTNTCLERATKVF